MALGQSRPVSHAAAEGYRDLRQAARRLRMTPSAFIRLALQQVVGQPTTARMSTAPPPIMLGNSYLRAVWLTCRWPFGRPSPARACRSGMS